MSEVAVDTETKVLIALRDKATELGFRVCPVKHLKLNTQCYGRVGYGDAYNVIELDTDMTTGNKVAVLIHELGHIMGNIGEKDYKWDTEKIVDAVTHLTLEELGLGSLRSGYSDLGGFLGRNLQYNIYNKYADLVNHTVYQIVNAIKHGGDPVSTGSQSE